jgi:hypothetical protein
MLRLSVHAGPLETVSRFNRTDWLDIGYEKLQAVADYKVVLFQSGVGGIPEHEISKYPRWSASLWDLAARAMALCLYPDVFQPQEEVWPVEKAQKRPAYAPAVTGVLEHFPALGAPGGRRLASIEVVRHKKPREVYRALVHEDLQTSRSTLPFVFAPKFFRPVELVMRAALMRLTGDTEKLPPRPPLLLPPTHEIGGVRYIEIRRLAEPARTGFERWLFHGGAKTVMGAPEGFAPEALFAKFIAEAI